MARDDVDEYNEEIIQRTQIELAFEVREELYRQMFLEHPAAKLLIDPNSGCIVEANKAACTFYGYPADVLQQMSILQINVLPSQAVVEALQRACQGQDKHFFFKHRLASGSVHDVEIFSTPIRVGNHTLLYSIIYDITEKKQAERELRDSEEKNRVLVDLSFDAILMGTPTGDIVDCNPSALDMFGYSREEMLTLNIRDLMPNESAIAYPEVITEEMTTGGSAVEYYHKRKDGVLFPTEISSQFVTIGGERRIISYLRDISARKQAERELKEYAAAMAKLAAENAELLEQEQHQREIAEGFRQVAMILNSSLDLNAVLVKILDQLRQVIRHDGAAVFLPKGPFLVLTAGSVIDEAFIGNRIPIATPNPTAVVYVTNQQKIIADVHQEPNWITWPGAAPIRAWMGAPLSIGPEVIGVLTADSFEVGSFTEEDGQMLQVFANQAAIAIENARQAQRTRVALHETELLYRISSALTKSVDMQAGIEQALGEYLEALRLSQGGITLFDPGMQTCTLHALYVNGKPQRPGLKIRASRVHQVIFDMRQPLAIYDVEQDPLMADSAVLPDVRSIKSILFVPLIMRGQIIGLLGADATEDYRQFSAREISLAQAVADHIATAVDNARLFDGERRQREIAERALADLKATQHQLIHREKMASLGELTAGIAHEIKNPLNFVNNFAAMSTELAQELQSLLAGLSLPDAVRTDVDALVTDIVFNADQINQSGQRADSIVRSMLRHSRGKSGQWQRVALDQLLDEALHLTYHSMRARSSDFNLTIKTNYDPVPEPVEVLPQELSRAFVNVISNACESTQLKWRHHGGVYQPELLLRISNLPDHVQISIRDNGQGLSPQEREKIFQPFFTTKPSGHGTGLGLSITFEIITQGHRGTINAVSEEGEFCEFTIQLPKSRDQSLGDDELADG